MIHRFFYISLSCITALAFLWLAFRNIHSDILLDHLLHINPVWLIPFACAFILSHWFRSVRWGLLLETKLADRTLFAGLMLGYMINTVIPRMGELARPAYVGKRTNISTGKLLGTVVIERIVDIVCLAVLLVYVLITTASGSGLFSHFYSGVIPQKTTWLAICFAGLLVIFAFWLSRCISISRKKPPDSPFLKKIAGKTTLFWQGVVSIRNLRHRYLFIFYTLAIWLSYTAVFWFSFFLMDLHEAYSLGISDALVVMVFSAAGFAIPTPGGTGSFHYLVQQSLWIVCGVAAEPALTYALITHAAITAAVLIFGGAALLLDRIISRRTSV